MKSILKQTRLVLNPYIPPLKLNLLKSMIHDLGGEIVQDWDPDTICITDSLSLPPELESHFDQLKLATSQWIQAIHKHQKIYQLEHFSPDPKMIFSGFIVYGHKLMQENGDLQTLYGGVEAFGGQWRLKFHQDVTHVVAYNDDDVLSINIGIMQGCYARWYQSHFARVF
jgi:hypothetical protein